MLVCRAGEWMVSADKKGSVLAYEHEHNITAAASTHTLTAPNTQEIHHTISTDRVTQCVSENFAILHEMSGEERMEVTINATKSSHCYLTLVFSGTVLSL